MINSIKFEDNWQVPKYRVTRLQRQIHQPSFGNLGKLPPELLCMVFRDMTCEDLEVLHSCSTGGRIAILAFPLYHTLLKYAPTILAILKETGLARSFTVTKIYETFTSSLCTACGEFGGYVFLPSFTRCCLYCAETELKFLPISRDGAKTEFGVKGKKILDSLPQLKSIEGYYNSVMGDIKYYTQHLILFNRELVKTKRHPHHVLAWARHSQRHVGENSIKAHQRYMALTPLPCFMPKSASVERGVYCAGCAIRAKEHYGCSGDDIYRNREPMIRDPITDGQDVFCRIDARHGICLLNAARDRLHDSRNILSHLNGCVGAHALVKQRWIRWQEGSIWDENSGEEISEEEISETDT